MTSADADHAWPAALPLHQDRQPASQAAEADSALIHFEPTTRVPREALEASLRRRKRRSATPLDRESILLATAACLDEAGYEGTTIRRIARRLDCAVGSIYRYYADKRELLAEVCDRRFEPVREAAYTESPRAFAQRYLAAAEARPESYRLMFWLAALPRASDASATTVKAQTPETPEAHEAIESLEAQGVPGVPGVPGVVREIVEAWSRRLGSRAGAERMWFHLHGRASLGQALREDDLPPDPAAASIAHGMPQASDAAEHPSTGQPRPNPPLEPGRPGTFRLMGREERAEPTAAAAVGRHPDAGEASSVDAEASPQPDEAEEPTNDRDDLTLL